MDVDQQNFPVSFIRDGDYEVAITVSRKRGSSKAQFSTLRTGRTGTKASHWLMIGQTSIKDLLALKRIGEIGATRKVFDKAGVSTGERECTTVVLPLVAPENEGADALEVFLLCDSLTGVDVKFCFPINVIS